MKQDEIRKACLELMSTAEAAYVTSIGENDYPYTRAMFNLRNSEQFPQQASLFIKDDFTTLFTTNKSSLKISQIENNSKVSIYYCHPQRFQGLMLSGDMQIIDDTKIRHAVWNDGWERYYPAGPDDPDNVVMRLQPKFAQGWFQGTRFIYEL